MRAWNFDFLDPDDFVGTADSQVVESFLSETRRTEIGWHYVIDLTWIYSLAKNWPRNFRILDAGGGFGPTQFLLAEMGFSVTNIDLMLEPPDVGIARRYGTQWARLPSYSATDYVKHLDANRGATATRRLRRAIRGLKVWRELAAHFYTRRHDRWKARHPMNPTGRIDWIQGNLCSMPEIQSGTFDAVVSLSALEHVPAGMLELALSEVRRVLRSEGRAAITTSGTEASETWWHEPCNGFCFSASDLSRLFDAYRLGSKAPSDVLESYRQSSYLRDRLARFYRLSGNNGMPWGHWNPTYIPVGIWC